MREEQRIVEIEKEKKRARKTRVIPPSFDTSLVRSPLFAPARGHTEKISLSGPIERSVTHSTHNLKLKLQVTPPGLKIRPEHEGSHAAPSYWTVVDGYDGRQMTDDGRRETDDGRQMTDDGRRKTVRRDDGFRAAMLELVLPR
jgi:hypothetical protein